MARRAPTKKPAAPAQELPPATALVGAVTRGAGVMHSPEDDEAQVLAVIQLRLRGATTGEMRRVMAAQYGVGTQRVDLLLRRALERLAATLEQDHPFRRAEAVARLRMDLAELRNPGKDSKGRPRKKNWQALVAMEKLLADIEGTKEPVEVKVDVRYQQATFHVIAALSDDQRQELLDAARERKRIAEHARSLDLLPAPAHPARNGTAA